MNNLVIVSDQDLFEINGGMAKEVSGLAITAAFALGAGTGVILGVAAAAVLYYYFKH